ncbi:MAG: hypothetical protein ACOXZ9_02845 [Bacteroidales bacterium]
MSADIERSEISVYRNAENGKLNSVSSSIAMSFKAWQLKLMHSEVLQLLTPNSPETSGQNS